MKSIVFTTLALLLSFGAQAQNQNSSTETKTTTTTVKDDKGERKIVKKRVKKELQNIKLNQPQPGTLNTEMKQTPVQVTSTTEVSVNGDLRTVDVDRSAYYMYNDEKYQVAADKSGYTVSSSSNDKLSFLRRASNNNYIYRNNDKFSIGHFDANGNLVLETYDEKTDQITVEVFNLQK
jgi:hypothetical protein